MKRKLPIHRVITYHVGEKLPDCLAHELPRMQEIYQNLFDRGEPFDFNQLLKHRGKAISLGLFYGKNRELAAYAIAGVQLIRIDNKTYAIISAGIYSDLKYNIGQNLAKFALMKSIKYKLAHPSHRLGYLAEALNPASYSLAANILPQCYPHPFLKTPKNVFAIIKAVSGERNFIRDKESEFIVRFSPNIRTKNPGSLLLSPKGAQCHFYHYYLTLNPEFESGLALLTYMPLTLKNIFLGIKNYILRGLIK